MLKDVQLLTYSSCTLPSLAGVYGCRYNEGGVLEVQFNLEAKRAGSPHVVKSSEDCCCFCESSIEIEEKARNLVSSYPADLEDTLPAELMQFAAFVRTENPVTVNESTEMTMYKLLTSLNLPHMFPNVEIVLQIDLCMTLSNASGERSFSKLSRVEGDLRSSMGQERLSMLTLMSMEHAQP